MASRNFTAFAPAERAEPREVRRISHRFADAGFFGNLMDYLPEMVVLLNPQRQILYANRRALDVGGIADRGAAIGMRFGELLRCKNLRLPPHDCGTTEACWHCGFTRAVLDTKLARHAVEECRLVVERDGHEEAMDLRVFARATAFDGETLTFVAMQDIAEEKRRVFLERSFLHDLINTATALREFLCLYRATDPAAPEGAEYLDAASVLAERVLEEILAHQLLTAAESNQLTPHLKPLQAMKLLRRMHFSFNRPEMLNGRLLVIAPESVEVGFISDEVLVSRVLGNMIKNALEASPPEAIITMGCRREDAMATFWVHNETAIPEHVRLQLFYRNFSTKGPGRGLGTYSMKYFTEKYLKGRIAFTTDANEGTTFTASYPLAG
jgi:signal transduction histidine kinase